MHSSACPLLAEASGYLTLESRWGLPGEGPLAGLEPVRPLAGLNLSRELLTGG